MFTPQQIEELSFSRVTFGGYDMQAVNATLEELSRDYITLYKENALLKSKMRVLVSKLEEFRINEQSMKDALQATEKPAVSPIRQDQLLKLEAQLYGCLQLIEQLRSPDAVAKQIEGSLEALVGTVPEKAPKAPAKHPTEHTATNKYTMTPKK